MSLHDLLRGARYLLRGFSLINQSGVRRFAYLPMLINITLFGIAIGFGISRFDQWMTWLMPAWLPPWLADALMWLLWPLFVLLLLGLVFFTFSILANLLAAPFNGLLAEAVEISLAGQAPPDMGWAQLVRDAPVMLFNEIRKLGYLLLWMLPLLVLSFVPPFSLVAPLLWLLFSGWMLALDYHDYPMGNHRLAFRQQRRILRQRRSLALGFGLATLVATMIPLVNFLVIPAAVAGATALYVENLRQA